MFVVIFISLLTNYSTNTFFITESGAIAEEAIAWSREGHIGTVLSGKFQQPYYKIINLWDIEFLGRVYDHKDF